MKINLLFRRAGSTTYEEASLAAMRWEILCNDWIVSGVIEKDEDQDTLHLLLDRVKPFSVRTFVPGSIGFVIGGASLLTFLILSGCATTPDIALDVKHDAVLVCVDTSSEDRCRTLTGKYQDSESNGSSK